MPDPKVIPLGEHTIQTVLHDLAAKSGDIDAALAIARRKDGTYAIWTACEEGDDEIAALVTRLQVFAHDRIRGEEGVK